MNIPVKYDFPAERYLARLLRETQEAIACQAIRRIRPQERDELESIVYRDDENYKKGE